MVFKVIGTIRINIAMTDGSDTEERHRIFAAASRGLSLNPRGYAEWDSDKGEARSTGRSKTRLCEQPGAVLVSGAPLRGVRHG